MITPAPMNPIPVTIPWITRLMPTPSRRLTASTINAEPNETERPHARGPAVKIAIKSKRYANQRRDDEAQSDIEGIHHGIPSFFLVG